MGPIPIRQTLGTFLRASSLPPSSIGGEQLEAVKELKRLILQRLPRLDAEVFLLSRRASDDGFEAARSGEFEKARQLFNRGEAALKQFPVLEETALLAKTYWNAAVAYLQFRNGSSSEARGLLLEAMRCDQILENKFDYHIFHNHRVHMVQNLIRLEIGDGNLARAFETARDVLLYLAGVSDTIAFPGTWSQRCLDKLPRQLVRTMFAGILGDVAEALAGLEKESAKRLFSIFSALVHGEITKGCHPRATSWLVAKDRFLEGDQNAFLKAVAPLLSDGPCDTPNLWCSCLLDLCDICDSFGPDGTAVKVAILSRAKEWTYVSRCLRRHFEERSGKLCDRHSQNERSFFSSSLPE